MKTIKFYIEKYLPTIVSFIFFVMLILRKDIILITNFDKLIDSSLIVFSVLLGFLLTVSTLLHTINNKTMKYLKETHGYVAILNYLNIAIIASFFITTITLLIPIITSFNIKFINNDVTSIKLYFKIFYLVFIIYSLTSSYRFIHLFLKIIKK